ncbi:MAG: DUF4156 domain-containing protein [Gammaproteobacteria bacterium]
MATGFIAGCASRSLEPGAENIGVIPDHHAQIPSGCKFLGKISGNNIHSENVFISQKALEQDDINFLKNESNKLGANVVTFNQHQVIVTEHQSYQPKHQLRKYNVTTHNVEGNAYLCPRDVMSTFKQMKSKKLSKDKNLLIMQKYSIVKSGILLHNAAT